MESELSEPVRTTSHGSSDQSHLTYYSETLSHDELSSILSSSQNAQFVPDARPPKGSPTSTYARLKTEDTYNLAVEEYVCPTEVHRIEELSETELSEEVHLRKEKNFDTANKKSVLTNVLQLHTASNSVNGNGQRLLLFDDGTSELDMIKHDVECLLRTNAAEIVVKPGKNKKSEIWTRFGRIEIQGRRIKGFVACIYCHHVYAFGESSANARGTNSTSSLRKHRCPLWPAASIATTIADRSSPANPPNGTSSASPASVSAPATVSSIAGSSNGISVLLGSNPTTQIPIVIGISTHEGQDAESTPSGELQPVKVANNVASSLALNMSSSEQQEFFKQLVLLSAEVGIVPSQVASLDNLARFLVVLGSRYSADAVAGIETVLKSHSLQETVATSLATGCRTRLMDELHTGPGLALSLHVGTVGQVAAGCQVVLQAHCLASKTVIPLGVVRLTPLQKKKHLRQWLLETLLAHQLASLRRVIVCNDVEVVKECLPGETVVVCALTDLERLMDAIFVKANDKFKQLLATVEELAFCAQVAPQVERSASRGFYFPSAISLWRLQSIEQFDIVAQLPPATVERWLQARVDASAGICLSLDRRLLSDVITFLAPFKEYARKLDTSAPSLHLPLLFRLQLLGHCQIKPHDNDFVLHLKGTTLEILEHDLQPHLLHHMACVLHPAFKLLKKVAVSDAKKTATYDALRTYIMGPKYETVGGSAPDTASEETPRKKLRAAVATGLPSKRQCSSLAMFGEFGEFWDLSVAEEQGAVTVSNKDELDMYLEESLSVPDLQFSQVVNYWENRHSTLGKLSQVAKWILALPAVSSSLRTSLMSQLEQNGDAQLVLNYETLLAGAGPSSL